MDAPARRRRSGRSGEREMLEVEQILRAAGGLLHQAELPQRADAERLALEVDGDGGLVEGLERVLGFDAGDPLHHVERAEARAQPEVAAEGEVGRVERVAGELVL